MLRTSPLLALLLTLLTGCTLGLGDMGVFQEIPGDSDNDPTDEGDGADDPADDPADEANGDDDPIPDDEDPGNDPDDEDPDGEDPDDPEEDPSSVDEDGDGYSSDIDCNDYNPDIHPGASEVACDGVDNNCDDLFLPDDLDSDGDGYSPCLGDCDDSDAGIGSHLLEIECDGIDNDCDGIDDCDDPSTPPEEEPPPTTTTGSVCDGGSSYGAVGSTAVFGTLDAGDPTYSTGYYYETWDVTVPSAGSFTADLISFDFDAWVELYDSSCALVGYDDDSYMLLGSDASYSFSGGLPGETIHILATSWGMGSVGAYLLDIY